MKNITEKMEKHQNNINDLQQQLKEIKKTQKKLGIIIPTVTLVTLALLISPYIKMANAISSFEQLLIIISYPSITGALTLGMMGMLKDKEKHIEGKIETSKSIINYYKENQKTKQKKEQTNFIPYDIEFVKTPTLEQLRKAKQELIGTKENKDVKKAPVKVLAKCNKPNPNLTTYK